MVAPSAIPNSPLIFRPARASSATPGDASAFMTTTSVVAAGDRPLHLRRLTGCLRQPDRLIARGGGLRGAWDLLSGEPEVVADVDVADLFVRRAVQEAQHVCLGRDADEQRLARVAAADQDLRRSGASGVVAVADLGGVGDERRRWRTDGVIAGLDHSGAATESEADAADGRDREPDDERDQPQHDQNDLLSHEQPPKRRPQYRPIWWLMSEIFGVLIKWAPRVDQAVVMVNAVQAPTYNTSPSPTGVGVFAGIASGSSLR